jgi:hypothetical protein
MRAASFVVSAIVVAILAGVAPADAQWRAVPRRDERRVDVQRVINQVENRSDAFRRSVDRALDRSRLNGSRREDQINEDVKRFDRAVDRLRNEFDRRDSRDETRRYVEQVLREADGIGRAIRRADFARNVEREWSSLRNDLNTLASLYNLKPLRG